MFISYALSLLIFYSLVKLISSSEEDGDKSDMMLRHRPRKKLKRKNSKDNPLDIMHGVELPSFSFDYSEYILSATIERSLDSDDLHLAVFLLGHKTVWVDSYPFRTISTDISTLESWSKAAGSWNARENSTGQQSSGFSCR